MSNRSYGELIDNLKGVHQVYLERMEELLDQQEESCHAIAKKVLYRTYKGDHLTDWEKRDVESCIHLHNTTLSTVLKYQDHLDERFMKFNADMTWAIKELEAIKKAHDEKCSKVEAQADAQ